jgi:hypothetical protein
MTSPVEEMTKAELLARLREIFDEMKVVVDRLDEMP